MKVVVLQNLDMLQPAFDHRVGTRFAVFLQQVLFQRSGIHANTDRAIVVARSLDDLANSGFIADIARIDPQASRAAFGGFDGAFVVKMDIRNDRHRALSYNLFQGTRAGFVWC